MKYFIITVCFFLVSCGIQEPQPKQELSKIQWSRQDSIEFEKHQKLMKRNSKKIKQSRFPKGKWRL